jgi:hypothetical protein
MWTWVVWLSIGPSRGRMRTRWSIFGCYKMRTFPDHLSNSWVNLFSLSPSKCWVCGEAITEDRDSNKVPAGRACRTSQGLWLWFSFGVVIVRRNRNYRRRIFSNSTLSTANPIRVTLRSNPCLCSKSPVTNSLNCGWVINVTTSRLPTRWFSAKLELRKVMLLFSFIFFVNINFKQHVHKSGWRMNDGAVM